MNRCPACDYVVPPVWDTCQNCGAQLKATVGAATVSAAFVDLATGPSAATAVPPTSWSASTLPEPQYFDLLPNVTAGHSARVLAGARRASTLLTVGAGLGAIVAVGALVVFFA